MTTTFEAAAIEQHGWRQGAVLGEALMRVAREHAPAGISVVDGDWLILVFAFVRYSSGMRTADEDEDNDTRI